MFARKYLFETKGTRYKRYTRVFLVFLLLLCICYLASSLLFLKRADDERELSEKMFFKKSPDLVSVFTGDKGRIELTFDLANKYPSSKIFITGVYSKNTTEILIDNFYDENSNEDEKQALRERVEIDYLAANTLENVISMLRFLRKDNTISNVMIISSDYHILRIRHIINKIKLPSDNYQFYFFSKQTDYSEWRNIKILLREVFKFIKTWVFLMLWNI